MPGNEETVKEVTEITLGGVIVPDRRDPSSAKRRQVEVAPDGGLRVRVSSGSWRKIASGQCTASAASVFKAQKAYPEVKLVLLNADPSAVYYATAYLLIGSETAADTRAIVRGAGLAPGQELERIFGMDNQDDIQVLADTTLKITYIVFVKD